MRDVEHINFIVAHVEVVQTELNEVNVKDAFRCTCVVICNTNLNQIGRHREAGNAKRE